MYSLYVEITVLSLCLHCLDFLICRAHIVYYCNSSYMWSISVLLNLCETVAQPILFS